MMMEQVFRTGQQKLLKMPLHWPFLPKEHPEIGWNQLSIEQQHSELERVRMIIAERKKWHETKS